MHGLNDPTNPGLRAFAAHGGKLIIWQGWADSGRSPFSTLNYYAAVKKLLGYDAAARFLALFMIPGMYHCGGGPAAATLNMLTPLMAWVEDRTQPGEQIVSYHSGIIPARREVPLWSARARCCLIQRWRPIPDRATSTARRPTRLPPPLAPPTNCLGQARNTTGPVNRRVAARPDSGWCVGSRLQQAVGFHAGRQMPILY
jgi:hypothetical protein